MKVKVWAGESIGGLKHGGALRAWGSTWDTVFCRELSSVAWFWAWACMGYRLMAWGSLVLGLGLRLGLGLLETLRRGQVYDEAALKVKGGRASIVDIGRDEDDRDWRCQMYPSDAHLTSKLTRDLRR